MLLLFSCSRILGPTPFTDATDSSLSGLGELLAAREPAGPAPAAPPRRPPPAALPPGPAAALHSVRAGTRGPGARRAAGGKAGRMAEKLLGGRLGVPARLHKPRAAAAAGGAMQVWGCGAAAAPLDDVKT
jgi:hypothetical protein